MRYESYDKEKVMNLQGSHLVKYVNYMLSKGYTLSELNKTKGIRRQTVRDRLKKGGYTFDKEQNQYIKHNGEGQTESNTLDNSKIPTPEPRNEKSDINTLDDVKKELESLKMRIKALEEDKKAIFEFSPNQNTLEAGKLELIPFHTKAKNRNYPLYPEVYERLDRLRENNPQIKIKDVVNSILYKALVELEE